MAPNDTAKQSAQTKDDASDVSRRNFMKTAAMGAGATAAAIGATQKADAKVTDGDHPIQRPDKFDQIESVPPKEFSFPALGSDVFAEVCKNEGLAALFCCPGNYSIISSIANAGIPTYGGRLEGPMCSAADAFIRVTGEIAAASGTEGPGFTNMICAIAAANACKTPLLVLASNMSVRGDDTQRGLQRAYQQPQTEGIKKYGKRVVTKERVHEYAGYAFRQLKSGTPGPVHLDFVTESTGRASQLKSELEIDNYYDKTQYRTDSKPHPDPKDIDKAIALIKQAKRPLIVANMGVFYSRSWDALRMFAEKAQIPVTEAGPMRGHFSDGHPLSASTAPKAMMSVDLAILVGQYQMPASNEYKFDIDCKHIRIDPNHEDIGRNVAIDVGIVSEEGAALEALYEKIAATKRDAWVAEVAAARDAFEKENEEHYQLGLKHSVDCIHPAVIAREINEFLYNGDIPREQTTVASGGFGIGRYTRRQLRAYRPGQICNGAYQYGSIGPDVGYAFGCGIAMEQGAGPQKPYQGSPVLAVTGDAGFAYSGMEIETLAKYRVPAIVVVYNNNAWGTWSGYQSMPRVAHVHLFQENLRYDKIAEALGGHGEYVTGADQMRPALDRAWEVAVNDRLPTVINCQAKKEFWIAQQYPPGMLGKTEPGCMSYNH
jgi:thiamine pyrophosphate-dependent acetolactate synthase large subunit-like protein